MPLPLYLARDRDEMFEVLHEHLDDDAFDAAWEEGAKLTLDEAVALALEETELGA